MTVQERFWSKVEMSSSAAGCWNWIGGRCKYVKDGPITYGKIYIDRVPFYAHRVAWELFVGPIPDGIYVLHSCDNPPCVNYVDHLFLGTPLDNAVDREMKERGNSSAKGLLGENHWNARLTLDQAREIREARRAGSKLTVLAEKYGMDISTISKIGLGKLWKHVVDEK